MAKKRGGILIRRLITCTRLISTNWSWKKHQHKNQSTFPGMYNGIGNTCLKVLNHVETTIILIHFTAWCFLDTEEWFHKGSAVPSDLWEAARRLLLALLQSGFTPGSRRKTQLNYVEKLCTCRYYPIVFPVPLVFITVWPSSYSDVFIFHDCRVNKNPLLAPLLAPDWGSESLWEVLMSFNKFMSCQEWI